MNQEPTSAVADDADNKWMYRVGAVAALIFGAGYVVIIALFIPIGAPPADVAALLDYIARHTWVWQAIIGISVLTDFLLAPVTLALVLALRSVARNTMLLAATCVALFVFLDLALTWTNYAALVTISANFAAAAGDAQRTAAVAAAAYPAMVLDSTLLFVYNTLTLSIGILLIGVAMRKGLFAKGTAYLGIVTGVLGIVAVAGPFLASSLELATIIASLLTTVWAFVVGIELFRLSRA